MIGDYEVHEAALLFPEMGERAFMDLCDDIKENGLLEPLVLYEGKVLDGRHRLKACQALGVTPRCVDWDGECGTPVAYAISKNLHRRHLTPSQLSLVGADMLPLLEEEKKKRQRAGAEMTNAKLGRKTNEDTLVPMLGQAFTGKRRPRSSDDVSKMLGISHGMLSYGKQLRKENNQDLEDKVRKGEMSVKAALREVKRGEEQRASSASPEESEVNQDLRERTHADEFAPLMLVPPIETERACKKIIGGLRRTLFKWDHSPKALRRIDASIVEECLRSLDGTLPVLQQIRSDLHATWEIQRRKDSNVSS